MLRGKEFSSTSESLNSEFTYEEVEELLKNLDQTGVLGTLRVEQAQQGGFFDPEKGYVDEYDESPVRTVFDTYREVLIAESAGVRTSFSTSLTRQNLINALTPDSKMRRLLLAYYNINEETPWCEASDNIVGRQSFKSLGFPRYGDVSAVLQKINKSESK